MVVRRMFCADISTTTPGSPPSLFTTCPCTLLTPCQEEGRPLSGGKGKLLFSSVELVCFGVGRWLCSSSKMNHILAQQRFECIFELLFAEFHKKYLYIVVRKHGCRCFTAMCHFRMQCFFVFFYSELLNQSNFSKCICSMYRWPNIT